MELSFKLITGEEYKFSVQKPSVVVGRSTKCDVVIPHEGVSRQHCQIELEEGKIFVTDLGSTNGVVLDGERLETGTKKAYLPYMTLSFGAVQTAQIEPGDTGTVVVKRAGPLDQYTNQAPQKVGNESPTLRIELDQKSLKKPKKEEKKKKKKEKDKDEDGDKGGSNAGLNATGFVGAILLIATIWWFFNKDKLTDQAPAAASPESRNAAPSPSNP